jgi:hypothetical protein
MPNTELLNRTLNYIEAHPKEWDQDAWARRDQCGTAYCFAGTTVMLSGLPLDWHDSYQQDYDETASLIAENAPAPYAGENISTVARDLLELGPEQADNLFDPRNTLNDLRRLVAEFTAGEPPLDAEPPAGS